MNHRGLETRCRPVDGRGIALVGAAPRFEFGYTCDAGREQRAKAHDEKQVSGEHDEGWSGPFRLPRGMLMAAVSGLRVESEVTSIRDDCMGTEEANCKLKRARSSHRVDPPPTTLGTRKPRTLEPLPVCKKSHPDQQDHKNSPENIRDRFTSPGNTAQSCSVFGNPRNCST